MVLAKTEVFNETDIQLADIAKALAHPARVHILRILNEMNTGIVGELVNKLPLSQSTVSQHLKELKRVGLIKGEIEGPKICYCLNEKIVGKAKESFSQLFSAFKCC